MLQALESTSPASFRSTTTEKCTKAASATKETAGVQRDSTNMDMSTTWSGATGESARTLAHCQAKAGSAGRPAYSHFSTSKKA